MDDTINYPFCPFMVIVIRINIFLFGSMMHFWHNTIFYAKSRSAWEENHVECWRLTLGGVIESTRSSVLFNLVSNIKISNEKTVLKTY